MEILSFKKFQKNFFEDPERNLGNQVSISVQKLNLI